MHRLQYSPKSLIQSIDVAKTAGGSTRAYLHAGGKAGAKDLQEIRQNLQAEGWSVTPYNLNGQPTLEVRGFGKEKKLAAHLAEKNFTNGSAEKKGDTKTGFGAWVKENTFMLVGALYWIGDWSYIAYGKLNQIRIKDSNAKREQIGIQVLPQEAWQNTAAGAAYFAGSGVASIWGRNRSERQYRDIAMEIADHYEANGQKLPEGTALAQTCDQQKNGFWAKFNNFMAKYTAEITNGFFGLAGGFIFLYGLAKHKEQNATGKKDLAPIGEMMVGLSSAMAGIVSILVKEKHVAPDEKAKRGVLGKAWGWVQERPLSIAAGFLGVSTATHAILTIGEVHKNKKHIGQLEAELRARPVSPTADADSNRAAQIAQIELDDTRAELKGNYFRGAFVASNVAAEGAMLTGKKTHGEGVEKDQSVLDSILAGVAEVIQKGGTDRETAILEHAEFLSSAKLLGKPQPEIAAQLRHHLDISSRNPWIAQTSNRTSSASPDHKSVEESAESGKWVAAYQNRAAEQSQPSQHSFV